MNFYYLGLSKVRISWLILSLFFMFTFPLQAKEITSTLDKNQQDILVCEADLKQKIDAILNKEELKRSHWGVAVKTLDNRTTTYELNAQKYFTPASSVKLLTTAAALLKFGGNYQIQTPIYGSGLSPNLRVLKVVGKGDPTLTSEQLESLAK